MSVDLKVENISFSYGATEVLKGVSFELSEPNLTCIIGPNGVGKTTLARCVNRLLRPLSGRVTLDGTDINDMTLRELAVRIGYVPNSSGDTFPMSVMDTVLMGRHPRAGWTTSDHDLEVVEETIRTMGLEEYMMRDFNELSAGQHQRVMIARGLAQEPDLLILDEPTSNLDVRHQMEVMELLRRLTRERGITILMVCHDLNITARYADRILMMSEGKIHSDGTAAEVMTERSIMDVYGVRSQLIEVERRPHIILLSTLEDQYQSKERLEGYE
ncbi:MAG: ABC transporter ATP-binding protein [Methanomassiliicoccus sp.]|nr:ABC transporter ATP-binding protein [Methanomassiliicoccus sp.]